VKWLLRYLKGTTSTLLIFCKSRAELERFVNADLSGDFDGSKSITRYVFTLGGTTVSWMSKLQKCIAMSTTELEYVAMSEVGKEMV